jgi:hypothetical protein
VTTAASAWLMRLVAQARPLALIATLPGTPSSVPVARRLACAVLGSCSRADDLMLAANAIAHSASGQGGSFSLSVRTGPAPCGHCP